MATKGQPAGIIRTPLGNADIVNVPAQRPGMFGITRKPFARQVLPPLTRKAREARARDIADVQALGRQEEELGRRYRAAEPYGSDAQIAARRELDQYYFSPHGTRGREAQKRLPKGIGNRARYG